MEVPVKREDCEVAIKTYLNSSHFVLKDYQVRPLSDNAAGFMGTHLKLTATVEHEGQLRKIPMFVKMIPSSDKHRSLVVSLNLFDQEVRVYNDFVPKFISYLPRETKLPVAKCYFTRGTGPETGKFSSSATGEKEIIILEDLAATGYRLRENFPPMDVPHCRAVLKSLAIYHAGSILLEESYRKSHTGEFDPQSDIFTGIKETFLVRQDGHHGYECIKFDAESMATAALIMWPEKFEGVSRETILKAVMDMWDTSIEMAEPSTTYCNVLCHGDPWTNNIMFSYEKDELGQEVPLDAILLDLQVARYAPPVLDIILFLYVCTRRDLRERHLKDFIKFYHDTLAEYAPKEYIERVLPFERLLEMYDHYLDFGIIMCTGYHPIILSENDPLIAKGGRLENPVNIEESMFCDRGEQIARNCAKSESYREWITGSFQECFERLNLWK
ncbi:uncharacterized protein LOC124158620 isoform X3 [Ischnura elegans]|uniref:uncharacterized protein LOC124158620 isoform X3 n=1 Tax=Ischnura elegans TaxID=197161 RepID=UPI001ED8851D|nr:uncharacterized protein LOC124158620 isoform X3 [Ischnura elegans]